MKSKTITVFEGVWGNTVYAFALDDVATREAVEHGYAFGDPSDDEYAIGNTWAESDNPDGWRIVERTVVVACVVAKKAGDFTKDETVHLIWQCPYCNCHISEDLDPSDTSPLLLSCGFSCEPGNYVFAEF